MQNRYQIKKFRIEANQGDDCVKIIAEVPLDSELAEKLIDFDIDKANDTLTYNHKPNYIDIPKGPPPPPPKPRITNRS